MMCGRHEGPKFAWKPALGRPGSDLPRCSKVTAAWRSVSQWLRLLLVHWGSEHGGSGHLPTLMQAKWRIIHGRWEHVQCSHNGTVFVDWLSRISSVQLQDKVKVIQLHRAADSIAKAATEYDIRLQDCVAVLA